MQRPAAFIVFARLFGFALWIANLYLIALVAVPWFLQLSPRAQFIGHYLLLRVRPWAVALEMARAKRTRSTRNLILATAGLEGRHAFHGKTVVVTGASAGIGRATALQLAREGARIALVARDRSALEQLRREIEHRGGEALVIPADVSNPAKVLTAAARIESQAGPIELWVNNAMVTVFSPVAMISPEEFRRVTEVTYLGSVYGTMAALAHMRRRNRGTIVQIGSALAYRGIPLQAAYCGAKHALRAFTEALRAELIHEGSRVRVMMIELPAVNTPQFDWARTHMDHLPRPVAPVFQPEIVAEHIVRAARNPAREYWLGLSTLLVIIGNMLAPGLVDRYAALTAYDGQSRNVPVPPTRDDNLFHSVKPLHRTRGSFSREARGRLAALPAPLATFAVVATASAALLMIGYFAASLLHNFRAPQNAWRATGVHAKGFGQ